MSEPSIKELLKKASLPERAVSIVMDRALVAEFQRAEDDLEDARQRRAGDRRLASEAKSIAERIEALREQMKDSTITFTLRGMRAVDWRAIKAKHPMGDDPTPVDQHLGADTNGLFNEAVRASIVSPTLDDEDWSSLLDVLTEGEWDKLTNAVYALNEEGTGIPFSRAASMTLATTADD